MSIAAYLKEIGRGKEGARSLGIEQAEDLMNQVLDRQVSDLEIGGFALAMRIKGESTDELAGFLRATEARCQPIHSDRPVIVLPSYNGARKLPNLTPLLALLLAQEGLPVLVHGPSSDPGRVTTADIFQGLGIPVARDERDVHLAWARHEPAFMPVDALCAPLARLLDVRWVVGLRNSGHTIAKLLSPVHGAPALRVTNYTHPEYATLLSGFIQQERLHTMLLRGTEGEPVADPRRLPRIDVYLHGEHRPECSNPAHEGVLAELPVLPRTHDTATTAHYIQSVVSGEKPAPSPLLQQVDALRRAVARLGAARADELIA